MFILLPLNCFPVEWFNGIFHLKTESVYIICFLMVLFLLFLWFKCGLIYILFISSGNCFFRFICFNANEKVVKVSTRNHSSLSLFPQCWLSALEKDWWNAVSCRHLGKASSTGKPSLRRQDSWNGAWSRCGRDAGSWKAFWRSMACRKSIHSIRTSEYRKRQDLIWLEDNLKRHVWKKSVGKHLISDFSYSLNSITNI